MTSCEWDGCADEGTHTVAVTYPEAPAETWHVCRPHEKELKNRVRCSRPRKAPSQPQPAQRSVACASCGTALDESPDQETDDRTPCPTCGSLGRQVNISVTDSASAHDSVQTRQKWAGKGGWTMDVTLGDDYTRDLDAWGHLERVIDHDGDRYREVIDYYDGTRIESTARRSDHRH